jgi:hypothetical protein
MASKKIRRREPFFTGILHYRMRQLRESANGGQILLRCIMAGSNAQTRTPKPVCLPVPLSAAFLHQRKSTQIRRAGLGSDAYGPPQNLLDERIGYSIAVATSFETQPTKGSASGEDFVKNLLSLEVQNDVAKQAVLDDEYLLDAVAGDGIRRRTILYFHFD